MDKRHGALTANERINAIAWAAKRRNLSYGAYQARLTDEERDRVYLEYAEHLRQRRQEEQDRLSSYTRRMSIRAKDRKKWP